MNEELKTIKLGNCLAGQAFVFEVTTTNQATKVSVITYEVRTHGGYLGKEEWHLKGTFTTFEEARASVDAIRAKRTLRAVY